MSAFIQGKGDVFGPIGAVAGNIPVFDGVTGKIIKDGKAAPAGTVVGTTDAQELSNKTLADPSVKPAAGATIYRPSGLVYINTTQTGTIGSGLSDLYVYNVPAGMMSRDGDCLRLTTLITAAANANAKDFRIIFGSETAYSRTFAWNNLVFQVIVKIIRIGPTSQFVMREDQSSSPTTTLQSRIGIAQIMANPLALKVSATGAATNDMVATAVMIEFLPAP